MRALPSRILLPFGLVVASILMFGCGAAGNNSSGSSQNGNNPPSNVQTITVNGGPDSNFVDGAFTSVTVCVPGSTTSCQTISGILVDTGSSGLRILSSALTVSLPQQTNSSSNPIAECAAFASGITWGPVQTADVKMAGEVASSMPIQVIGSANFSTIPANCTAQGVPMDDLANLGANGLLGMGQAIQDCGSACATSGPLSQGTYYACPSSGCTDTTESLAQQVQNPVAAFATDNNGVIIELPAVSGGEASLSGSLIFGIGTQSNNGLGGATVFGTDPFGDFSTTYKTTAFTSFLDSGSNGIYFLDSTTTGIPLCTQPSLNFLYCPASAQNISVVDNAEQGTNGASGPASFPVGNGLTLVSNPSNNAINGLAGPFPGLFDFGLPFFFGRNVFTAFDGKSTPAGTGPFTAF
jgi:Protein of unknown function (DUF3443)